jgi:tagatose 1,6-diphosphate aldolase
VIFRRFRAEYSDGVIDLIPLHISPPAKELEFGHEQIWSITLHNQRREIGQISYRTGESRAVYYFGHIGYHVDPAYRGHHYAARACQLLRKEILLSGKCSVVITCDPDNLPSRKTCQSLGCRMESVCSVPEKMQRDFELSPAKCRYIWKMKEER